MNIIVIEFAVKSMVNKKRFDGNVPKNPTLFFKPFKKNTKFKTIFKFKTHLTMKIELKQEAICKPSLAKNHQQLPHTNENLRPSDQSDTKYYLPKIGQNFLNISAYNTKFRDSKYFYKRIQRNLRRQLLQNKNHKQW